MTYKKLKEQQLNDPSIKGYHKAIMMLLDDKDVVDALNVLDALKELFKLKYKEQIEGAE